jgi:hypothetical protein
MQLFNAANQWATRPDDERFESLKEMYEACNGYRQQAREAVVRQGDVRIEPTENGLALMGKEGKPATMTHWAFGQMCARLAAPPDYLRSLSPQLAAANLNFCLQDDESDDTELALLLHENGRLVARALTSTRYSRIWNSEVSDRLMSLPKGWRVPPARPAREGQAGTREATKQDVIRAGKHGIAVKVGDLIAPAGLYASDHDMFAFMVNEELRIKDGSAEGLARGFFVWNSEVGASSFGVMTFLYKSVCGNHIVWGAQNVTEVRVRHVGQASAKSFGELEAEVTRYAEQRASDEEARIRQARKLRIGDDKGKVLDAIFKLGIAGLSKATIAASYDTAEQFRDDYGDPRTLWGMVNGITHYSQDTPFAEERVALDRAAGRLLQAAF